MPTVPHPSAESAASLLDENLPTPNGHPPAADSFEAKLIHDLDGAIRERRDVVIAIEAEVEAARARLAEANVVLKRYEDTRKRLVGEPLRNTRPRTGEYAKEAKASKLSDERANALAAFIRQWAATAEVDEFRQIDIRTADGAPVRGSGDIAIAFEALRQRGLIRFARKSGNNKYYRLTAKAAN